MSERRVAAPLLPEEFRCPISLELMWDPVILSTGQSYDRRCIQRWLDAGHRVCPKTKQPLQPHDCRRLIPNYALRSLIHAWAAAAAAAVGCDERSDGGRAAAGGGDRIERGAAAELRSKAEGLVRELKRRESSAGELRDAIRELRSMAKESLAGRAAAAEAGGVAAIRQLLVEGRRRFLLGLGPPGGAGLGPPGGAGLGPPGSPGPGLGPPGLWDEIEENAVVALLNMSSGGDDGCKVGMVAEGAVDALAAVLCADVSSADSKAVAALAVTSLAMVEVNRASVGRRADVACALVGMLRHASSPRARKDAAIALYSLAMLPDNRPRLVAAAAVPILLSALTTTSAAGGGDASGGGCARDEEERGLALLDALSGCGEGCAVIRAGGGAAAAALVAALAAAAGRAERSRESAAAVLCAVCGGHRGWAALARGAGAAAHAADMVAAFPRGSRAARKAAELARILDC